MDIRLGREFIAIDEFAERSGLPLDLLESLMDSDSIDFVSFQGARHISWEKRGNGISPLELGTYMEEVWRESAISKKKRQGSQDGTP